jgi:hypothetical protein
MPELFPVVSSRLTEMGYDANAATIFVRFTDGTPWCYYNVPDEVWQQFVSCVSKGRFINDVLNHYPHGRGGF